jgi:ribosome-associated toxin RatA of RatAB toxin-antitoxin module
MEVRRSALVAHPAERLFALIEAAEHYPAFLPWCSGVTLLERSDTLVSARIEVAWHGVRFAFVTRNPKQAPTWMAIGLADGPFRRFEGEWRLTPLGDVGCRVEFRLAYDFAAGVIGTLAAPVFDRAANTLVDAFVRRADEVAAGRVPVPAPPPLPPRQAAGDVPAPERAATAEVSAATAATPAALAPEAVPPPDAAPVPAPDLTPVSARPAADSNIDGVPAAPTSAAAPPPLPESPP